MILSKLQGFEKSLQKVGLFGPNPVTPHQLGLAPEKLALHIP
jgi:hypothetical protein